MRIFNAACYEVHAWYVTQWSTTWLRCIQMILAISIFKICSVYILVCKNMTLVISTFKNIFPCIRKHKNIIYSIMTCCSKCHNVDTFHLRKLTILMNFITTIPITVIVVREMCGELKAKITIIWIPIFKWYMVDVDMKTYTKPIYASKIMNYVLKIHHHSRLNGPCDWRESLRYEHLTSTWVFTLRVQAR